MQDTHTWTRWAEGLALIAGAVLALSPIWVSVGASGIATMIVLGALIFLAGLYAAISPGILVGGWANGIFGVLAFIAPWVIGYNTQSGAAWTSWVVGVVAFVVGLVAFTPERQGSRHNTLAHGAH
jgi:hypothetical protein